MGQYYDIVFVVLVYKNTDVLYDFFKTLKTPFSYHVVVVNSYFDEESEKSCKEITQNNGASFIPVPNRGYGTGNNVGCDYVLKHFDFKYLIISNSDIVVKTLSYLNELKYDIAVYAPETIMLNGHKQNPNLPFYSRLFMSFLRWGYEMDSRKIKCMGLVVNRFYRECVLLFMKVSRKKKYKIFSPHGSFIVFTKSAVNNLRPIFFEEMFLYNEELFLAFNCRKKGIPIYYVPELKVVHLEGASSSETDNSWKNKKHSFNVLMKWIKDN